MWSAEDLIGYCLIVGAVGVIGYFVAGAIYEFVTGKGESRQHFRQEFASKPVRAVLKLVFPLVALAFFSLLAISPFM